MKGRNDLRAVWLRRISQCVQFFPLYLNGFLCRFKMVVLSKRRLSCSVRQRWSPGSSRNSPTAAQYSSVPSSQTFLLDSQDDGTEMSVSAAPCAPSCSTASVVVVVMAVESSCCELFWLGFIVFTGELIMEILFISNGHKFGRGLYSAPDWNVGTC